MFDRLSIRTKLIAIVAAPLVVILVLAGLGFSERQGEADRAGGDTARLATIAAALELEARLELESMLSIQALTGAEDAPRDVLDNQRKAVDEARQALDETTVDLVADAALAAATTDVVRSVAQLDSGLRPQVDERVIGWTWSESLYRSVLDNIPALVSRLVVGIEDGDLGASARTVEALGAQLALQGRTAGLLTGTAAVGSWVPVERGDGSEPGANGLTTRKLFVESQDAAEIQMAVANSQASSDMRSKLSSQLVGEDITTFDDTVRTVRNQGPEAPVELDQAAWVETAFAALGKQHSITSNEIGRILSEASDARSGAEQASRLYLAGALVAILAALALAITVGTSIARPVIALTAAADRVATEQLPRLVDALQNPAEEDIDRLRPEISSLEVTGGKELAQLSASVNQIQAVAVNVATEQAALLRKGIGDMFINLARRNQGLLDRQLEFIDELEAQEDDPDQLEHLFKLDHMATRMRRNAESLLVLAGAEPGRRRGKPVPLTKVALAAVGEIEHFARVDLLDVDEAEVVSAAAADLAHLLSELMENATQFSPPHSRVEVVGHRNNGGGYTVSISDQGIGMATEQMADANVLMAKPPLLGLTLARTLGFIVVGRLAARHGIGVRLVPSPSGGVTAIVAIPTQILVAVDRLDLSDRAMVIGGAGATLGAAAPVAPAGPPAGTPVSTIDTPSSILPPFEFYSGPVGGDDDLGEVELVPYAELDGSGAPAPASLSEALPHGDAFDQGLSTLAEETVAPASPLSPVEVPQPATAPFGPLVGEVPGGAPAAKVEPTPSGPRLFGNGAAPTGRGSSGGTHLFRKPAEDPPAAAPGPAFTPGPAFPLSPTAPAPTEAPPLVARIPGPGPAENGAAPGVLPTRQPAATPAGADPAGQPPTATTPPDGAEANASSGPELTSAGLVKRVPRRSGGVRAVPGADGPGRAASTSSRSPEEVRAMLSRFHSGKQAGKTSGPEMAPSPEPKDH